MKSIISPLPELAPIVKEVKRILQRRLQDFGIENSNDGLVLSGEAASWYVKQLAQHVVSKLSGLPIARNQIDVACHPFSVARSIQV